MKKLSYYFVLIVGVGALISFFWVYQRYFKSEEASVLLFQAERGALEELVKVRGEVAAQQDFELEFPFSGRVERIFVSEGATAKRGDPLMKLETIDFELDEQRLRAVLSQQEANLSKLLTGATPEDIKISETKVANAQVALDDAQKILADKIRESYTVSDDAVRNKADQLFNNPRSSDPQLKFIPSDAQLETNLEFQRLSLEGTLTSWGTSLDAFSASSNLQSYAATAKANLNISRSFLEKAALAVNGATPSSNFSQTTIDSWKSSISTARTNINAAISNLLSAEEKFRAAESALSLAESELQLKTAGTRSEDIAIARAQIDETKNQIAAVREKIRKSTLYAPTAVAVTKVWFKVQELFRSGQAAISLRTLDYKLQADVSELEIGKIREQNGHKVRIALDAFPGEEFVGQVVSIEPKEIVKDGDKYYRVNVDFDEQGKAVRSGMSADLTIQVARKENVVKIPELAVTKKNGGSFVTVKNAGEGQEIQVVTGISDGESIEIVQGLQEGQTVIVSTE